jgi:polar amino acid transport system permease protein
MSLRDFGPNELMFLLMATRWTILLALITFIGGGALGFVIAAIRVAPVRPLRWLAAGYIQFFMGTPILIQLFMIYYATGRTLGSPRR